MSRVAYSTRNTIGVKLLPPPGLSGQIRFLGKFRGLGDGASDAAAAGIDAGTIATLQAFGATDAQLEALANGQIDVATLMNELSGTATVPGQGVGTSPSYPAPAALATTAQLQQMSISQTGYDLTDESSWYDINGQMQAVNSQIQQLEAVFNANPKAYPAAAGQAILAAQNAYTDAASKWITVYETAFGTAPSGVSAATTLAGIKGRNLNSLGLGFFGWDDAVEGTAIIAAAAVLIAALVVINTYIEKAQTALQVPAQQAASATQQSLLNNYNQTVNAANAAAASGNSALAAQYLAAAQSLANQLAATGYNVGSSTSPNLAAITQWFTSNWAWVAILAGVVVLGPPLIKKL